MVKSELGEGRNAKAPKDSKTHELDMEGLADVAETASQAASGQGSILGEEEESEGGKEEEERALEHKLGEALLAKAGEK